MDLERRSLKRGRVAGDGGELETGCACVRCGTVARRRGKPRWRQRGVA